MNTRSRKGYARLIKAVKAIPPMPTSVAHPCDDSSLARAVDAAKLGARVPITLTRRADSAQSRLASCTVAVLVAYRRRESAAKVN